jgi:hypothetical protein
MNVVYYADNSMVNGDEFDGHSLGRFSAADDEDQLAGASLGCSIGSNDWFAQRLLLLGQGLDNQEFDTLESFVFLGGNDCANDASELHVGFSKQ